MPIPITQQEQFPKTAKDRVYSVMKDWIIEGTLQPGEKVFDKDIANYFSVSRTPVREAFQLLSDQKLLIISPGKESRVASLDIHFIRQAYEILSMLEALAVRYASARMTEDDLAKLIELNDTFRDAIRAGDAVKSNKADHLFHDFLLTLSDNDFLIQFCGILETHVARSEIQFFSQETIKDLLLTSVSEHEQIIQALKENDIDAAADGMRDNWLNTIPYIDKVLAARQV